MREEDVQERITSYATVFGSTDRVLYIWYKPPGILVAHEGKYRVAFMRAHGQPPIAVWVSEAGYPSTDRIVVVRPDDLDDRHGEWFSVLDGRYLQVLRRPCMSVMMLEAYGVKVCYWRDFTDVHCKTNVLKEVYRRGLQRQQNSIAEDDRTLDLEDLLRQDVVDDEMITRNLFGLKPYRILWRRFGVATVCRNVSSKFF